MCSTHTHISQVHYNIMYLFQSTSSHFTGLAELNYFKEQVYFCLYFKATKKSKIKMIAFRKQFKTENNSKHRRCEV